MAQEILVPTPDLAMVFANLPTGLVTQMGDELQFQFSNALGSAIGYSPQMIRIDLKPIIVLPSLVVLQTGVPGVQNSTVTLPVFSDEQTRQYAPALLITDTANELAETSLREASLNGNRIIWELDPENLGLVKAIHYLTNPQEHEQPQNLEAVLHSLGRIFNPDIVNAVAKVIAASA